MRIRIAQTVSPRTTPDRGRARNPTDPNAMDTNGDVAAVSVRPDTEAGVVPVLMRIADSYPPAIAAVQGYIDVPRNAFNLSLLFTLPRGARIGDIGGGLGLFSPGCAALGFEVTLVDDFRDAWQKALAEDDPRSRSSQIRRDDRQPGRCLAMALNSNLKASMRLPSSTRWSIGTIHPSGCFTNS